MQNLEKNARIRQSRRKTLQRRKSQEAKVYELKIDKSRISNDKLKKLQRLFLEGKRFTNSIIANRKIMNNIETTRLILQM